MSGGRRPLVVFTLAVAACGETDADQLGGPDLQSGDAAPARVVCGEPEDTARPGDPSIEGCEEFRGEIKVEYLPLETSAFPEVRALTRIGQLRILDSVGVTGLGGFERLERVDRNLMLVRCENLMTLEGLRSLRYVGAEFILQDSRRLETLRGLDALEEVGGTLNINYLDVLVSLEGLGQLRTAGALAIAWNPRLTDLAGLASLRVIEGDLVIRDNPRLPQSAIDAFLARVTIRGEMRISGNAP